MVKDDAIQTLIVRVEEMRDAVSSLEAVLHERCPMHARRLDRVELILENMPAAALVIDRRLGTIESALLQMGKTKARVYAIGGAAVGGLGVALIDKFL